MENVVKQTNELPKEIFLTRESDNPNDVRVWRIKIHNSTQYIRSDLIPQPVTDEARAKALEYVETQIRELSSLLTLPFKLSDYKLLQVQEDLKGYKTIKAALSHPIPVQDA